MFALLSLALLIIRRSRFGGTTLVAPYRWSVFSLVLLGMVAVFVRDSVVADSTLIAMRYAAAVSTFCPIIALLGAKRPQNTGWQFIVVSLWGILVLPVGEMLVLWRGGELDLGAAHQWFLVILLLVSLSNYALTRFGLAALVATAGQTLLLLPQLPFDTAIPGWHFVAGSACLTAATAVAWLQTRSRHPDHGWDRVWLDFRNAFGMVWSLRVMERINSAARLADWQSELHWFGFLDTHSRTDGESEPRHHTNRDQAFRSLLRRFVSETWIAQRLGTTGNSA